MIRSPLDSARRAKLVAAWRAMGKPEAMRPDRFCELLDVLGWSNRWLADYLDMPPTTVHKWGKGMQAIPAPVAVWLERLAHYHAANQLPAGWEG
jgi:hypothetical protein